MNIVTIYVLLSGAKTYKLQKINRRNTFDHPKKEYKE